MSPMDDTQPNRGRPVLKQYADVDIPQIVVDGRDVQSLWMFCGEFDGSEQKAVDAASLKCGPGIYKTFPSGSWPGGYLRD